MENTQGKSALASPKSAKELLDMYFLDIRSALLESAAALDRVERAEGGSEIFDDPRLKNIKEACDIVKDGKHNRAEQFLQLFSDPVA